MQFSGDVGGPNTVLKVNHSVVDVYMDIMGKKTCIMNTESHKHWIKGINNTSLCLMHNPQVYIFFYFTV